MYDCVIAGAGPGGLTAAIYLKRAGYNIKVIAGGEPGGNLTKISCVENYPGFLSITGKELADNMINQCNQLNIDIDYFNYVLSIDNNKALLSDNSIVEAKSFIIAIGSLPNHLDIKSEKEAISKGFIKFCATCDGPLFKDKKVAVLGGGNSAIDSALVLSKYCSGVTIIHRRSEFRADQTMQQKLSKVQNINLLMNSVVSEYTFENTKINVHLENSNSVNLFDAVFYSLGYKPNILRIKNSSNIKYIGDCVDIKYRQIITACGDGCKAALDLIEVL